MSSSFNCSQLVKKSKLPVRGLLLKYNPFKLVGLLGKVILVSELSRHRTHSNCPQPDKSRVVNLLLEQLRLFRLEKSFKLRVLSNFSPNQPLIYKLVISFLVLPKLLTFCASFFLRQVPFLG